MIKAKLHLLTHIPGNIRRFGLAVRNSTEIFECFNAVFRMCSVLSNHQAPSRDIAMKFSDMERVKHIVSGGFWHDEKAKKWFQAGASVRSCLTQHKVLRCHLGWTPPGVIVAGESRSQTATVKHDVSLTFLRFVGKISLHAVKKSQTRTWGELFTSAVASRDSHPLSWTQMTWRVGVEIETTNGDKCKCGAWSTLR